MSLLFSDPVQARPGDLDTTFSDDGKTTTNFLRDYPADHPNDSVDHGNALVVQPDGKIVVVGVSSPSIFYSDLPTTFYDFALVRYLSDGSLDREFGTEGLVTTDFNTTPSNNGDDTATAVALQGDGKIVVGGYSSLRDGGVSYGNDFVLARYNSKGTLDTTFGNEGKVRTNLGGADNISAIVLLNDGRILAAGGGGATFDFSVVRYNSNGTVDTTFGPDHNGVVTTDLGGRDSATAMALQSDGKIVVAGTFRDGLTLKEDFALVRYQSDGALDNSFDGDGKVITDFGSSLDEEGWAVAVQPDGMIVVAGCIAEGSSCYSGGTNVKFALARYDSSGRLDSTFGTEGKVITPFAAGNSIVRDVAIDAGGRIIAAGYAYRDFALVRYQSKGEPDPSFGINGQVTTDLFTNSYEEIHAVTLQDDGKMIGAGYRGMFDGTYSDFALARYLGDTADLAVTKTDTPDPVSSGEIVTYTIEVTNNGPDRASKIVVTDTLPDNVELLSNTMSPPGTCAPLIAGPDFLVKCSFDGLNSGEKLTVTLQIKTSVPGTLTNTATVSGIGIADPSETNNTATTTTTVQGGTVIPPGEGTTTPGGGAPTPDGESTPPEKPDFLRDGRAGGGGGCSCSLECSR